MLSQKVSPNIAKIQNPSNEAYLYSHEPVITVLFAGEMRGEAAPYSLVPSAESSLLQEKEGQGVQVIKEAANIITDKSRDKKRR